MSVATKPKKHLASLIEAPEEFILIPQAVINDSRLNHTEEVIYGYLRRLMNVTLNNLPNFYDRTNHFAYVVASIDTLATYVNRKPRAVKYMLRKLDKLGYIDRTREHHFRQTEIRLPKAEKYYKVDPEVTITTGMAPQVQKIAPTKVQKIAPLCSNKTRSNKNVSYNTAKKRKLIKSWAKNTNSSYGFPKEVTDYIAKFLIEYKKTPNEATNITHKINKAKKHVNKKFKSIFHTKFYKNETNPYLQNQLINTITRLINKIKGNTQYNINTGAIKLNPKDKRRQVPDIDNYYGHLVTYIEEDYFNYIVNNSHLKLKDDPEAPLHPKHYRKHRIINRNKEYKDYMAKTAKANENAKKPSKDLLKKINEQEFMFTVKDHLRLFNQFINDKKLDINTNIIFNEHPKRHQTKKHDSKNVAKSTTSEKHVVAHKPHKRVLTNNDKRIKTNNLKGVDGNSQTTDNLRISLPEAKYYAHEAGIDIETAKQHMKSSLDNIIQSLRFNRKKLNHYQGILNKHLKENPNSNEIYISDNPFSNVTTNDIEAQIKQLQQSVKEDKAMINATTATTVTAS